MPLVVPLQQTAAQNFTISLNSQSCQIAVYQKTNGLFMDLAINNITSIVFGEICQNLNRIVRYPYIGFLGDFIFYDTQGVSDPEYTGLGTRYQLLYLFPSEVTSAVSA